MCSLKFGRKELINVSSLQASTVHLDDVLYSSFSLPNFAELSHLLI